MAAKSRISTAAAKRMLLRGMNQMLGLSSRMTSSPSRRTWRVSRTASDVAAGASAVAAPSLGRKDEWRMTNEELDESDESEDARADTGASTSLNLDSSFIILHSSFPIPHSAFLS